MAKRATLRLWAWQAGRQTDTGTQIDTHRYTHTQTHAIHLCASFLPFVRVFNRRKSETEGIEERENREGGGGGPHRSRGLSA